MPYPYLSAGHRGWHIVEVGAGPFSPALCIKLPDDVEHEFCALFGIAGVGTRHVRRVHVEPAQNVWVAGLGPIGQFLAQAARAFGAYVTVTDPDQRRLDVAKELGAHRAINVSDPSSMELLKQRAPYNCIIDACGNKLLARRGVIGAVAVRAETTFHWSMLHGLEGSIEVSCHFSLEELNMILHFLKLGTMAIKPLVTHRVPITEVPRIYETMRDRRADLLGVTFNWKGWFVSSRPRSRLRLRFVEVRCKITELL